MKIKKIKSEGQFIYPATIAAAVKDANFLKKDNSPMTQGEINLYLNNQVETTNNNITSEINKLDLSKYVTQDQFTDSVDTSNLMLKSNVATINGQSLINGGNIEIDSSIYKVVTVLPTENISIDKIYLTKASTSTSTQTNFECWKYENEQWNDLGPFGSVKIDLSAYLSKTEADQRYMVKSSNQNSSLIVMNNGQVNNLGDNGQAYNAIRNVESAQGQPYKGSTGSGFPLNCASFGVKTNGTASFSHKKYSSYTYDKTTNTDKTSGAQNTAVLVFSGKSGLLYAKNTGTANDVTEAMYRRIGVIDSPDDTQKCYSAAQVDAAIDTSNAINGRASDNIDLQINSLKARIEDLENQNADLYAKVNLLLQKCNVTEEELGDLTIGGGEARGFMPLYDEIEVLQNEKREMYNNLKEDINNAIFEVTTDYSLLSNIPFEEDV